MSFIRKIFGSKEADKDKEQSAALSSVGPSVMGLRVGCSFEVDALMLKLVDEKFLTTGIASIQIIEAAGEVILDDCHIFRFYTDDEAFIQVVTQGGVDEQHVIDVKLFHYYDTLDVSSEEDWNSLLNTKIGKETYSLAGKEFKRVWTAEGDYHQPVHMNEKTTDPDGDVSHTDQFTMLFEREIDDEGNTESLFLSAEETVGDNGQLTHCLVQSTGMTLTPANLTIHG